MTRIVVLIFAMLITSPVAGGDAEIADTFTKVALYIFDGDFAHSAPESIFSTEELDILQSQKADLVLLINKALGSGDSVVGADLVGNFELYDCVRMVKHRFLKPGTTYGWEGRDYSDARNYLTDDQYVYHSRYFAALETLYGADITANLNLTKQEIRSIYELSLDPRSPHYFWALWMLSKLKI